MSDTFYFELVSPERKLLEEPARAVNIPAVEGRIGVLPNHSALVTPLKPGVVTLTSEDVNAEPQEIFIAGGFADISGDNVTILAEDAAPVSALDQAAIEKEMEHLELDLRDIEDPADRTRIQAKMTVARAKLDAIAA